MKIELARLKARTQQGQLAVARRVVGAVASLAGAVYGVEAKAAINATAAATGYTQLVKLVITAAQYTLVVAGVLSIGYGLNKWRKKGHDNGGDQIEARQIFMPIAAGTAMICIWAVVSFVVSVGGGSDADIGATHAF